MSSVRIIGMILMLAGIGGMIWGAVEYFENRTVLDLGDTRVVIRQHADEMPVQGVVGFGIFLAGAAIAIASRDPNS